MDGVVGRPEAGPEPGRGRGPKPRVISRRLPIAAFLESRGLPRDVYRL
jgi:hypothetical protein